MKKLVLLMFLLPMLAIAQSNEEYRIFESSNLTPKSGEVEQLEAGLKAHNQKYHSAGDFGVRVFWIANGPNTGSYHWSMGSFPWSAMDNPPFDEAEHAAHWNKHVRAHTTSGSGEQRYMRFHTELSQFPKDFTIKNLHVTYYDVKRGEWQKAMALVKKVTDVYHAKLPNKTFGIYTNEMPSTKDSRDIAVISFFEKSAWMGENHSIKPMYEEMYGEGSFAYFMKEWIEVTDGSEDEIWIYLPDISGIDGDVKGAPKK